MIMLKTLVFETNKELLEFVNKYVDRKDIVSIFYGGYFNGLVLYFYTTEKSEQGIKELKLKTKKETKNEGKDLILVLILAGIIVGAFIFLFEKFI